MDKPKTKLVKSKSSNSAITSKSEPRKNNSNKKTRSNAEFEPLILKKRGMYVEKKPTNVTINEQNFSPVVCQSKQISTPRPIPRPGRKRFLDSVLTILSQSTTGTQYPDKDDRDRLRKTDRTKIRLKKKKDEEAMQEESSTTNNSFKKRQKYRSKILNDNDSELEQLVVLQTTKEITHTPSNNSDKSMNNYKDAINTFKEPETIQWADILTPLAKNITADNVQPPEEIRTNVPEKGKEKRVRLMEDPSTLVSEVPKKEEKKLYNFFKDLLETTFSVYNVKAEINPPLPSSVNSSKVALEMDESVANKLDIRKTKDTADDLNRKPSSKYFYFIKPDPNEVWGDKQLLEHFQPKSKSFNRSTVPSPVRSQKIKRRLQSESFDYKTIKPLPYNNSISIPNKRIQLKKNRKKNFINLLKEQLKMEDDAFEEPQNLYQALKVIAKNKRRCQKSIHFRESKKTNHGDGLTCQLKRRKLLSVKSGGKKNNRRPSSDIINSVHSTRNSSYFNCKKPITITETSETMDPYSEHSLEVFGFDYETNNNKMIPNIDKGYSVSYYSSAATSAKDYNIDDAILKYCSSGTSSMMGHNHFTDARFQEVGEEPARNFIDTLLK